MSQCRKRKNGKLRKKFPKKKSPKPRNQEEAGILYSNLKIREERKATKTWTKVKARAKRIRSKDSNISTSQAKMNKIIVFMLLRMMKIKIQASFHESLVPSEV